MESIYTKDDLKIVILTKEVATEYISKIYDFLSQIPMVEYTEDKILADGKEGRQYFAKWERSLALFKSDKLIGIIIGYERLSENNDQYPVNSVYISELAVDQSEMGKGYGKLLVEKFLEFNKKIAFKFMSGDIEFSVQTNGAEFNRNVQGLYEKFGFKKIAEKVYDNRVDNVYLIK